MRFQKVKMVLDFTVPTDPKQYGSRNTDAPWEKYAEHGYFIRKLNQAYFAFHGTYADDPASVSPLRDKLLELRRRSSSVGEFARSVAGISTPQGLDRLLQSP